MPRVGRGSSPGAPAAADSRQVAGAARCLNTLFRITLWWRSTAPPANTESSTSTPTPTPTHGSQPASDYLVAYLIDGDSPGRELRLGFDTTGRLLETVVLILNHAEVGIHAMKARGSYFDLLPPGREGQP